MKYFGKCSKCGKKFEFDLYGDVEEAIDRILKYHINECSNCKENKDSQ